MTSPPSPSSPPKVTPSKEKKIRPKPHQQQQQQQQQQTVPGAPVHLPPVLPTVFLEQTRTIREEVQEARDVHEAKEAKKRKARRACLYCQRSHMTCDDGLPFIFDFYFYFFIDFALVSLLLAFFREALSAVSKARDRSSVQRWQTKAGKVHG